MNNLEKHCNWGVQERNQDFAKGRA